MARDAAWWTRGLRSCGRANCGSRLAYPLLGSRVSAHSLEKEGIEPVSELVGVAAGLKPGVRPVRSREREQCRGRVVEVAAQLAKVAALTEARADPLLVAAP